MFEVDLADACGGILSLALEESLGKGGPAIAKQMSGDTAIVGPAAKRMAFLDWKPQRFVDPLGLEGDYSKIAAIQCLPQLEGVRLANVNNKLYAVQGNRLVDLTPLQLGQAKEFMKRTGLRVPRGATETLPLELHSFLVKVEKALAPKGKAVFIDYGHPGVFNGLTQMRLASSHFSHFLAGTNAGRMHVINGIPYYTGCPHPIRDKSTFELLTRLGHKNKLVPWLDLETSLAEDDRKLLEPFIHHVSTIFSSWSELVMGYKNAANEVNRLLGDSDGVTQLHSTFFVLRDEPISDFGGEGWSRANEIAGIPNNPPIFATVLEKVYK